MKTFDELLDKTPLDKQQSVVVQYLRDNGLHEYAFTLAAERIIADYRTKSRRIDKFETETGWKPAGAAGVRMRSIPILPAEAAKKARVEYWDRYTLFGGQIRLKDAKRSELERSAAQHKTAGKAAYNAHNARAEFEIILAKRVGGFKHLSQAMTAKEVEELAQESHV